MSKLLEQINTEKKPLGSVLEVTSSKRIYLSEYKKQGIPFFRSKEIIESFKGKQISSELFISNERYNEIKDKFGIPQKGDILLTSIGTIGIPFRITNDEPFYFKDGNLTWFRNYNGIDSLYLYYWITSSKGQQQIESHSIGSSQSALTIDSIKKLEIDLPNLPTQKKIAEILSAYDSKIENNNIIIKNLETTAQTIFNEWFVNFRFPGYEKVKMVESEMGEIPEGWEVKNVLDVIERIPVGKKFENKTASPVGKVPILDQGASGFIGYHNEEPGVEASIGNPVVVFTNHTCYYRLLTEPFSCIQNVLPYIGKGGYETLFVYFLTKEKIKMSEYKGHWPEFEQQVFVIPTTSLAKKYTEKVFPFVEKMIFCEKENISLKSQRDRLLAKLI
jgi:restriction endonuclease S subunit